MRAAGRLVTRTTMMAILLGVLAVGNIAAALDSLPQFQDAEKQQLYDRLVRELRCLVCQNQNLMDSNADLATDLRRKTHEMVGQGQEYGQIVDFMVNRYGNFVLYRPPVNPATFALWALPFACLALVALLVARHFRRQATASEAALSNSSLQQANRLLGESDPES